MNKVLTIVQARMASTRLPGKVLMPLGGKTLLEVMLERLRRSALCGTIVVATTEEMQDDVIVSLCKTSDCLYFRGDSYDLLDRHYRAAMHFEADIVVKIPSDCPLIDFRIVDAVLEYFLANSFDYVSNLHPASFPDGNDVEVMSMHALRKAWLKAERDFEREHTTPYMWEHPDKFSIGNYLWPESRNLSMSHRFTIDYPEDYAFINAVYEELYHSDPGFSLYNILELLEAKPEIYAINQHYSGVNWYRNHLGDLKTIDHTQTKMI